MAVVALLADRGGVPLALQRAIEGQFTRQLADAANQGRCPPQHQDLLCSVRGPGPGTATTQLGLGTCPRNFAQQKRVGGWYGYDGPSSCQSNVSQFQTIDLPYFLVAVGL